MYVSASTPRVNNRSKKKISEKRERKLHENLSYKKFLIINTACSVYFVIQCNIIFLQPCNGLHFMLTRWIKMQFLFFFFKKKSRFRSQIQVKLGQWQKSFGCRPCTDTIFLLLFYSF